MSRERLLASLPPDGSPGRTWYVSPGDPLPPEAAEITDIESPTGVALFTTEGAMTLVFPPFEIEHTTNHDRIETSPLVELLTRPRAIAAFLIRRGGYTVGFFRGDFLVSSKTDRRFVKNRHRKGGQSQRRFDRIREKQIHELYRKACEDARATLAPYESEIQHVFLGGDRQALIGFRKQCDYFDRFGPRLLPRLLPVVGDPRRASLDAVPREAWSSDVWIVCAR
jgi:hypothetical protein